MAQCQKVSSKTPLCRAWRQVIRQPATTPTIPSGSAPGSGRGGPVRMPVVFKRGAGVENVLQLAPPTMTALVCSHTVDYGAVSCFLQIEIESSVNAQAGLMHFLGAEVLFKLAANFFLKPRGK